MNLLQETRPTEGFQSEVYVRISTSAWNDSTGLHYKKTLRYLRRRCAGHNFVEEDAQNCGADLVIDRINGIHGARSGIYKLIPYKFQHDYETGNIEDWEYKLERVGN